MVCAYLRPPHTYVHVYTPLSVWNARTLIMTGFQIQETLQWHALLACTVHTVWRHVNTAMVEQPTIIILHCRCTCVSGIHMFIVEPL